MLCDNVRAVFRNDGTSRAEPRIYRVQHWELQKIQEKSEPVGHIQV